MKRIRIEVAKLFGKLFFAVLGESAVNIINPTTGEILMEFPRQAFGSRQ